MGIFARHYSFRISLEYHHPEFDLHEFFSASFNYPV